MQPRMPAKTPEVFEILKRHARELRTVTYGEIAEEAGLMPPGVGRPLDYIRDYVCRPKGLPLIDAIAVRRDARMPGDGFLAGVGEISGTDFPRFWRGMALQVFAIDWSSIELEP